MLYILLYQLNIISLAALLFSGLKIASALKNKRYQRRDSEQLRGDERSVSVCLPARNETGSMTECLESVLLSSYPKLETIVLDDNSSDNTPHLIRAFAHAGVRFVAGNPLPDDWLGKNFALETLLNESSGHYVVFMDVDTRVERETIGRLVALIEDQQLDMLSVIPQRFDTYRPSAWFGTLRYFWEIILDSRSRPASSAAMWVIRRQKLIEIGGFERFSDQVQPEQLIAKMTARGGKHKMIVSTPLLGVSYAKKWSSQIETSRRTLLPSFYNSTAAILLGFGLLTSVVLPQMAVIVALTRSDWVLFGVEAALGILSALVFWGYLRLVWRSRRLLGLITSPLVAWQELSLLIASAVGYRLGRITWKGRPVSRPTRDLSL